ncbi:hypothetical protein N0V90_005253 [Kalmusia sp. IMI 367209]|nr:hypothetical protein N0V90_005253 [Kalmusia sp. IMI 367209]
MDSTDVYTSVKDRYTATAMAPNNSSYSNNVAQAFGYSPSDLASIPAESNLGLSCGNPLALANLKEGETVIDLGCGAGFDCFLARRKVGPTGRVIGVDMNEDMLAKARRNAEESENGDVEFLSSRITRIALEDAMADVIISNCVINLVPHEEKHLVFREIFRLLKPGGRLAVSDILTKSELPEQMKSDVALYVGCIAGASKKEEYEAWLEGAAFREIVIVDAGADLNAYTRTDEEVGVDRGCCGPAKPDTGELESAGKIRESNECCGSNKQDGSVIDGMKTNFKDVDLNKWAGKHYACNDHVDLKLIEDRIV